MNNFRRLLDQAERTSELLDLRNDRVNKIARSVLNAIGIKNVGIEKVYIDSRGVRIEYGWSCRGCSDSDDRLIPLWVFEADDPAEAAKEYAKKLSDAANARERQEKVEKLKRLQEELGVA